MPLVAFCLSHFLADSIICMCDFDFRQAQGSEPGTMPADKGVRLDDRQRTANSREQPIETNEYHSVDGAEGEFLWSSSPQNVDLLPQHPNLGLKHYPRPDQIDSHPTNEPTKIPHCKRLSSDSRSTAKPDKVCDRDKHLRRDLRSGFAIQIPSMRPNNLAGFIFGSS